MTLTSVHLPLVFSWEPQSISSTSMRESWVKCPAMIACSLPSQGGRPRPRHTLTKNTCGTLPQTRPHCQPLSADGLGYPQATVMCTLLLTASLRAEHPSLLLHYILSQYMAEVTMPPTGPAQRVTLYWLAALFSSLSWQVRSILHLFHKLTPFSLHRAPGARCGFCPGSAAHERKVVRPDYIHLGAHRHWVLERSRLCHVWQHISEVCFPLFSHSTRLIFKLFCSLEIGSAYVVQVLLLQIPLLVIFSSIFNSNTSPIDVGKTFSYVLVMRIQLHINSNVFFLNLIRLLFSQWDVTTVFLSVFLLSYVYIEGKSTYFKGSILTLAYCVFIASFYYVPQSALSL
jgi:hypothetical protein